MSAQNPPDPSAASGPNDIFYSVNDQIPYTLQLNPFVLYRDWLHIGDARNYYDHYYNRFFHVYILSQFTAGIDVNTAAPIGTNWFYYDSISVPGGLDQPTLAFGGGHTILVNRFSTTAYVYNTVDLLNGYYNVVATFTTSGFQSFGAHPRDGDTTVFAYVVSQPNNGGYTIQRIDGALHISQAHVNVATTNYYTIRNGPFTFSYPVTADPQDVLLSSDADHLYIVSTALQPSPLGVCQRVFDINHLNASPFAPHVNGSQLFCDPGTDVWEGSVGQSANGTVFIGAACSGPLVPISPCWSTYDSGGIKYMTVAQGGSGYYNGRIGDFSSTTTWWADGGAHMLVCADMVNNGQSGPSLSIVP